MAMPDLFATAEYTYDGDGTLSVAFNGASSDNNYYVNNVSIANGSVSLTLQAETGTTISGIIYAGATDNCSAVVVPFSITA